MEFNYFEDDKSLSNGGSSSDLKGNDSRIRDSMGSLNSGLSHRSIKSQDSGATDAPLAGSPNAVGLKKQVGLWSGTSIIVGTMIGSGIFISPKGVTEGSGSVGLSLIIWTVCGIISALGSLALAELGTLIPKSGGEYPYLQRALGPQIGYLFAWASILMLKTSSVSIICLTCAEYIIIPIYDDDCGIPQNVVLKCTAMFIMRAISYAELGTLIQRSGAEHSYLLKAFGPLGRVGGLPAFLFSWIYCTLLKPASVAIIILAFATYCLEPINQDCYASLSARRSLAAFAILVLLLINCFSVRLSTWLQMIFTVIKILALIIIIIGGFAKLGQVVVSAINCYNVKLAGRILVVFTAAKIIALCIIIVGGIVKLAQGYTTNLSNGFTGTESNIGKIAIGIYNGMWAYDGWNNLNYVTEEITNPTRNLPLAIMIGIPLVTVLYVLVNISYFTVMSATELLASPAVAITWADEVIGGASFLIPVVVAMSTFGAALGSLFASGRLPYAAAREGHMVEILSMIHIKRSTPLPSLVFTCIIALIMIIPGDIGSLIDFFSFAVWLFYGLTMAALLVLRYTMREEHRPYKVPIIAPIFVLLVSCYLVVAPIIDEPRIEYLYAFLFIIAGLIFYFPFVHFKKVIPGMDKFTLFMQLLMEVVPPTDESDI